MENTIKETTRLLLQGTLTKDEADKILLDLFGVIKSACDCSDDVCCYKCEFEKCGTRNLSIRED